MLHGSLYLSFPSLHLGFAYHPISSYNEPLHNSQFPQVSISGLVLYDDYVSYQGVWRLLSPAFAVTLLDFVCTLSTTCTTAPLYTEGGTWPSSSGLSPICGVLLAREAGLAEGVAQSLESALAFQHLHLGKSGGDHLWQFLHQARLQTILSRIRFHFPLLYEKPT